MKINEVVVESLTESKYCNGDLQHDMALTQAKLKMKPMKNQIASIMADFSELHGEEGLEALIQFMLSTQTEAMQNEAVYDGNMGVEEAIKFFMVAEEENPKLAQEVEDMLENDQIGQAWKVIQEFLGVNLKGKQFEGQLDEIETDDEKRKRKEKDLGNLEKNLRRDGNPDPDMQNAISARRQRLVKNKFGGRNPKKTDPNKTKKYDLSHMFGGKEGVKETASAGATSAGNIASVDGATAYSGKNARNAAAGSPGKMGKSPKQPKPKMQKPTDNALNKDAPLMGGGKAIKR